MPVLGCDVGTLLNLSQCVLCLTDTELLAAETMLREQRYANGIAAAPRNLAQLLAAAEVWSRLTEHQQQAIEVRQICNENVIVGARTSCEASVLKDETKCYCQAPQSDLKSVIAYLKCLQRQT